MASIRKLPSGNFNCQIRRAGLTPISKTFRSKTEAQQWLRQVESEIERDVFVDCSEAESTTLVMALNRYLKEITPSKKGALKEGYQIRRWMKHPLSTRSLASLKASDFASYRDNRLQDVSPASVRIELAIISHLFNVARKEWSIQGLSNPLDGIRKPKANNARNRRLTKDEMKRLLDACMQSKNPRLYELVELALETAMRLGEMISLNWSQVDITNRAAMLYDTKNGEDRVVPLSSKAIEVLNTIPRKTNTNRVFHVWSSSDGIKKSWHTALKNAGIQDFHFHDLRHEATSRLFEMGLNPMEVASITGHKSMQMLKRYTHPRVADLITKLDANR